MAIEQGAPAPLVAAALALIVAGWTVSRNGSTRSTDSGLFAARCHRGTAAIFTLQVNHRQTFRPSDDPGGQHSTSRTDHPDGCTGSSRHASLLTG